MTLLACEHISKKFKDQIILDDVSFTIMKQDRLALVGKNGIGKTTLLEILAGHQGLDSGVVNRARGCLIDYVEQEKNAYLGQTLFEFVADSRADLLAMRRQIRELEHYLEENPGDTTQLEQLGDLQQRFELDGGFNFENEISSILGGLGFDRYRYNDRLANFSGGEKNRAGLARVLAGRGSLLLLDEPTNHLDIESTTWLEEYLGKLDKAYIIVSHDRAFLNATVEKIWELGLGKIETYVGGFERYLVERQDRRRLAEHHYRHQKQEISRIEEFIRRNMAGQKTRQAQSKLKYLNRIKRLPPPRADSQGPSIRIYSSGRSFAHAMAVEDVALGYGDVTVLEEINFDLYRGEKTGVIGRNGSGKSTLLKALIGELEPMNGSIRLGANVEVAYFDQELSELKEEATVLDNLWAIDPAREAGAMRSFLASFGFSGEDVFKMVSSLSGGEKTKLCLARLLYHPANLIILDEPTNHLDIYAREALENALVEYDGSCLVVSHDRYFLDRVVDKVLYLHDGASRLFNGNYSYFKERMHTATPSPKVGSGKSKQDYLDFKERSKTRSRHKKRIQSTREMIARQEKELAEVEQALGNEVASDDWEQLQKAHDRKKTLEEQILKLYETLERLEATRLD